MAARRFAGANIVAVAKNYAKHKVEMGGTPERLEAPAIFLKPASSVIAPGQPIVRPAACADMHHEVELAVIIGATARHVPAADWRRYVRGYALGLDMTARDLQAKAKAAGMPWTQAKCYDTFTPLSDEVPASSVADPHDLELWLAVDGVERQRGSTALMMHRVPELLSFISSVMTLQPGDVILTGTPEGVGPVAPGSTITAGISQLGIRVSHPVVSE
jgi:acylpyruvate hydrolase